MNTSKLYEQEFLKLCDTYDITPSQITDGGYITDRINIWYGAGFISQDEHAYFIENWGTSDAIDDFEGLYILLQVLKQGKQG